MSISFTYTCMGAWRQDPTTPDRQHQFADASLIICDDSVEFYLKKMANTDGLDPAVLRKLRRHPSRGVRAKAWEAGPVTAEDESEALAAGDTDTLMSLIRRGDQRADLIRDITGREDPRVDRTVLNHPATVPDDVFDTCLERIVAPDSGLLFPTRGPLVLRKALASNGLSWNTRFRAAHTAALTSSTDSDVMVALARMLIEFRTAQSTGQTTVKATEVLGPPEQSWLSTPTLCRTTFADILEGEGATDPHHPYAQLLTELRDTDAGVPPRGTVHLVENLIAEHVTARPGFVHVAWDSLPAGEQTADLAARILQWTDQRFMPGVADTLVDALGDHAAAAAKADASSRKVIEDVDLHVPAWLAADWDVFSSLARTRTYRSLRDTLGYAPQWVGQALRDDVLNHREDWPSEAAYAVLLEATPPLGEVADLQRVASRMWVSDLLHLTTSVPSLAPCYTGAVSKALDEVEDKVTFLAALEALHDAHQPLDQVLAAAMAATS